MPRLAVTLVSISVIHGDQVHIAKDKAIVIVLFQSFCEADVEKFCTVKCFFSILRTKEKKRIVKPLKAEPSSTSNPLQSCLHKQQRNVNTQGKAQGFGPVITIFTASQLTLLLSAFHMSGASMRSGRKSILLP